MNDDPLFSAHWHRVRDVRPRLAGDVSVTRHVYRGRPCRVLQRGATSDIHRVDPDAFELLGQLDGRRTVGEVWERALLARDTSAPTQDEWISLLAALQAAELLVVDRRVSVDRLFERREERRSRERRERRLNPLYLRFALHDPDRGLDRLAPLARALFSRTGFLVWLALIVAGTIALVIGGASLVEVLTATDFPSGRVALSILLVYPPLKLLHELAHALAVKRAGGEVHEIGLALMVLVPLPYVDASASAAFPDKRARMLVAGAGILVELACAAIGALLWAGGSGAAAELGLALLIAGGVSTLLVNGNPLLRFDGYYLLADALEIPNLATRSRRAVLERLRRWLNRGPARGPAPEDPAERRWLVGYGIASAIYRTGLMLSIAWWLHDRLPVFGLLLALYAVLSCLVLPLVRGLRTVARDASLQGARSLTILGGAPLLATALALFLPLPHTNVSRGVVWLPDEAVVRVESSCEITAASIRPGESVRAGQVLFDCLDPELGLRERELVARADELDARLPGLAARDPAEHTRLAAERRANATALLDLRERIAAGTRVAALDGRFDAAGAVALPGRALSRGDIAGYVVPPARRTVRVALAERDAGNLEAGVARVELLTGSFADGPRVYPSAILARTPRASREVASPALGTDGGGEHRVDPAGDGRQVLEPVFDLELAWPEAAGVAPVGAHVTVRFVHPPSPLGRRMIDALRFAFGERSSA